MWKYITKEECNSFLLDLRLITFPYRDSEKIQFLYTLSNTIDSHYEEICLMQKGKMRILQKPDFLLKHVQKNILEKILKQFKLADSACAYRKGYSIKDNAKKHVNQKIVLKMDIKDFFDHINFYKIYNLFDDAIFPPSIKVLLTKLCTYKNILPQGAPTSPYLSNLVLKEFDEYMIEVCAKKKIQYTRYSDDMTFSGDFDPKEMILLVKQELYKQGFKINPKKTRIQTKGRQQKVTGIVVNEKMQVGTNYRKQIRQEMYFIKKYSLSSHLTYIKEENAISYVYRLLGKLNFILMIDNENVEFAKYKKELLHILKEGR